MARTLWIFNHYAAPPMGRHQALADSLKDYRWDTYIFAASTSDPPEIAGTTTELDGVKCRWLGTPGYSGNGGARVANMAAYTVKSAAQAILHRGIPRPDVVWGSTVHPGAPMAAAAVARRFRSPLIYEVRVDLRGA